MTSWMWLSKASKAVIVAQQSHGWHPATATTIKGMYTTRQHLSMECSFSPNTPAVHYNNQPTTHVAVTLTCACLIRAACARPRGTSFWQVPSPSCSGRRRLDESPCLFSARKNGVNKGKKEQIKLDKERAFDFLLQYVDQDTEHRRGKLTFRVHYILEEWYT